MKALEINEISFFLFTLEFQVSQQMLSTCQLSYLEHGDPVPLQELCRKSGKCDSGDYSAYVDSCVQGVLKVTKENVVSDLFIMKLNRKRFLNISTISRHGLQQWRARGHLFPLGFCPNFTKMKCFYNYCSFTVIYTEYTSQDNLKNVKHMKH